MADQNQYKQYAELDFQKIKEEMKTFMQGQDTLKDIDFEGSVVNVIMNLLANNTQYMAYYLHMMASEKFIATAQKRENVVGSANNVGYVPFSRKSSTAYLSFNIFPDEGYELNITIPKNFKFTTSIDGTTYTFLTTQVTTITPVDGTYSVTDLEVKEGKFFRHKFIYNTSDRFLEIPNKNIDTNRITVSVKESVSASTSVEYIQSKSVVDLSGSSEVYYIQEGPNGFYQIYFGDGVLGKALSNGNQVIVDYYITEGSVVNGAREFTIDDDTAGMDSIEFTNIIPASGGALQESLDSVRISSNSSYQAQDRAVLERDYETAIKRIYPIAKEVSAVGGEKVTPRQYGKVFISIIKDDFGNIPQKDKDAILVELNKNWMGLTAIPEIVDPNIIRLSVNTVIKYNNQKVSEATVKSKAINAIKAFASTSLNSFKYTLRKSKFEAMIDNTDENIYSNTSDIKLYIDTNDSILYTGANSISFEQAIAKQSLGSSAFTYQGIQNCQFYDLNGDGKASIYTKSPLNELVLVRKDAMTVNYDTGIISYTDDVYSMYKLALENLNGVRIYIKAVSDDIKAFNNTVFYLKDEDITVKAEIDN
jgi:hypothetical protein